MPQCQAPKCSEPIFVEQIPSFLYFVDHSQQPPIIHDIRVCHSNCRNREGHLLNLSGVLTNAKHGNKLLGFAEDDIDLREMLSFLEQYYGVAAGWMPQARIIREQILESLTSEKRSPKKYAHTKTLLNITVVTVLTVLQKIEAKVIQNPPTEQELIRSLTALAAANRAMFNPVLLPSNIRGYVRIVIGKHQPITGAPPGLSASQIQDYINQMMGSPQPTTGTNTLQLPSKSRPYAKLSYNKYEIPERTARGMIKYGHDFIKALAVLSTLTNSQPWITSNPAWDPEKIGNFLYYTLNRTGASSAYLPQIYAPAFRRNTIGWSLSTLKQRITKALES